MSDDIKNVEQGKPQSKPQSKPMVRRRGYNRRADDKSGGASIWLLSFTDVMALMLTFFVLLFSMSHPKQEQWEEFTREVQENFNRFQGRPLHRGAEDTVNIAKINFSKALDLKYLQAIITKMVEKEPSLRRVKMIPSDKGLIISLPQNLLFDVGQAKVQVQGTKALYILAGTLSRIKNRIEVVGHTDPRPVRGGAFASNWELSLARAANVAAVLDDVGYKRPITVRGHASARYYDLPETMAEQERLDLSRRVDVVVMEDSGKRLQLFDMGLPSIR